MNYSKLYSGEHLKQIKPDWTYDTWSYKHTFEAKMKHIISLLEQVPKEAKILDAGCGQGLLVQEFKKRGYDIQGIDAFYDSEHVVKDNILNNKFPDNTFDVVLCLDVIEHFQKDEQETLVKELVRITKPEGKIIWSIPNKGNLTARIFFFIPKLSRTAKPEYHPGDRTIRDYLKFMRKYMAIVSLQGLSPTIPVLYQLTQLFPKHTQWLYNLIKPFSRFYSWCFNVIVVGRKS
ncbi:MAG TPA: class I SAM-dependent methyltransferase [Candidatus Nanoarchaeia archaeon]|nr:class I SAM-dependent methyltransferase [Candidatus Nanoarchaeia archaeon]